MHIAAHAPRVVSLCLGLALAAFSSAARAGDATQILLNDGSILSGEVVDVQLGVRVHVRLDDGSVREVEWAELRAVPSLGAAPMPAGPALTGLVQLEWTGRAMAISAPGAGTLCTTPCTVRLPLGPTQLYVGGYQRTGALVPLNVTEQATRHVFYDAPRRTPTAIAPFVPLAVGLDVLALGATGLGIACVATNTNNCQVTGWVGLGAMALMTAFIVPINVYVFSQFAPARTGIAHSEPLRVSLAPSITPVMTGAALTGTTFGVAGSF